MEASSEATDKTGAEAAKISLGFPHWMVHHMDSYASMTLSIIKKLKLPVRVNERILMANDPYGIIFSAEATELGNPYYEIPLDDSEEVLAEVDALLELDAAGVRMDLVHELVWAAGKMGTQPTALLAAYRAGEDLSLRVDYLKDLDQHANPGAVVPADVRTTMQRAYDDTISYEWVNDLIWNDPARALFLAADIMDELQFNHAADLAPEMAARCSRDDPPEPGPPSDKREMRLGSGVPSRKSVDAPAAGSF